MNCKKSMSLLAIGISVILSAAAYASEDRMTLSTEDHISIKPVGLAQPGLYEITLFGERDSDCANVASVRYEVIHSKDYGSSTLRLYAVIMEGDNPGKCQYETKIKVYLDAGHYGIALCITDNESDPCKYYVDVYKEVDFGGCSTFHVSGISIPVNIENVSAEISGQDSFTLRNLSVPGYDGTYWGSFQWNPASLFFELKDAGME